MKNLTFYLISILSITELLNAQTLGIKAGIGFSKIYEREQPGPKDKIEHKTKPNIILALSLNWKIINNLEIEYEPGIRGGFGNVGGIWIVHNDSNNDVYGGRKYYFLNFDNNALLRCFLLNINDFKGGIYLGTGLSLNILSWYYYTNGMSQYEDPFFLYSGFNLSIGTSFHYKNLAFEFRLTRELFPMSISGVDLIKSNLFIMLASYKFN